jgi:monovalent cation:H+ antiporter, CPA1 family
MTGTGGLVFGIAGLLALIALLPRLAARLRLPYTVLLAALGCALGLGIGFSDVLVASMPGSVVGDFFQQLRQLDITADVLLWVFLPILLFDTATKLDGRELLDDLGPILILAVVAVLMTTAAAGLSVWAVSSFSLTACLLVAAIIATTDPSAVTAVFREVGARRRLTLLVEGESLLNDAAAIALSTTLLAIVVGRARADEVAVASQIVVELGVDLLGGALVGAALGRLAALVVSRIDQGGPAEVTLSVALAYLAYALAEAYAHVSGVVAVVAAGLVFGTIGRLRVGAKEWQSVSAIWTQLGFWASSLVFVLASMLVPDTVERARPGDLLLLAALLVGALSARALCIFGFLPVVRVLLRQRPIDARYKLVILWGGVRGAVTLALALAVSQNVNVPAEVRHLTSVLATGFVLFTLLVQATTLRPLIRWLGVDQLDPVERVLRARALALTRGEILDRLSETAIVHGLDLEAADEVGALYRERAATLGEAAAEPGEEMLRQQLLVALATITTREAAHYADEMTEGTISRSAGWILLGRTSDLLDAIKEGGVQPYRRAARADIGRDRVAQLAGFLHRRFRLNRPLARRMAHRIELRLIQRRVLESLTGFIRTRIRALFGERVSDVALHVIEARIDEIDRALDAIRLQYPAYWRTVSGRFLSRTAVRLELEAYQRMAAEGLLSPEILRHLVGELRARLESFEAIPPLDLGLDVDELTRNVPLLGELDQAARAELRRLLVPRVALPGERIVRRGERGDAMYFIASGAVEVQLGADQIRLGTGEFFGEMALIMRRPRNADVVALSYCRLLVLRRDAFRAFLRSHPELMRQVRRLAEERLRAESAAEDQPVAA